MDEIKDLVASALRGLQTPEVLEKTKLLEAWPAIAGPKIAPHSKPVFGEGSELIVWVDQPTLAYELNQKYKQALLKRTQAVLGEKRIKKVRFCVGQIR